MAPTPIEPFCDGRANNGRFAKGNSGGPGNPHAARVPKLRSALLEAVTVEDIQAVIAALMKQAKEGDVAAAKELLILHKGTELGQCQACKGYLSPSSTPFCLILNGKAQVMTITLDRVSGKIVQPPTKRHAS